jgi:hypothetical protein
MVAPEHTAWLVPATATAAGLMVTTTVLVAVQPWAMVAVSV